MKDRKRLRGRQHGQDWGKAYYHYIFNPEDNEDIEEESFYEMGVAMAEYIAHFMGHYQVLLSIHFDTQLHMHFITNNIDLDTGERMNLSMFIINTFLCVIKNVWRFFIIMFFAIMMKGAFFRSIELGDNFCQRQK